MRTIFDFPGDPVPAELNDTDILATESKVATFSQRPLGALLCNRTGGALYIKYNVDAIAPAANDHWWDLIVPDGETMPLCPCKKYCIYVPAGGAQAWYSGVTKNFSLLGFFL